MEACKYCNVSVNDDEYATALCEIIPTSDASFSGASVHGAEQQSSEFITAHAADIEASKVHWSELKTELRSDGEEQEEQRSNREVFRDLVKRTSVSGLFNQIRFTNFLDNDDFVLREKIAEGGQAEIYLAEHRAEKYSGQSSKVTVMKVFKLEGLPLLHLQHQLPLGFVNNPDHAHCSCIHVRLLDDGRFAFQMMRYWGDLRKLINLRMQDNHHQCPPFTMIKACIIMREIAEGMLELRGRNVTHRDLKASNVLVRGATDLCPRHGDAFHCKVADYECSGRVMGTKFWRAPEILRALKDKDIHIKPELFSESADVYSYAMTCYEVLTGKIPFEGVRSNDYEPIFSGQVQLEWPLYSEPKLKALMVRCSDLQPSRRPTFEEIVEILVI
ncbi:hypothetical protein KC19_5G167400 [Ceratodon purpureus]|uniref:Protein kinase domain-containing protein n=1 Tax=Ceratodon purpureus TaxID=3225 RepID=A0A8T0I4X0_CERPU|nr:hypothetical protein KC19_5G167400 [Ceratodon purpureus]